MKSFYDFCQKMLNEEMANVDINQIASQMNFQPVQKQKLMYQYVSDFNKMPAMSYTVANERMPVETITSDGKETQNVAEVGDIIMSGPS